MDTTHRHATASIDLNSLFSAATLPALPQSAVRLMELSEDPRNGPSELAEPIECDPALASQLLRFANSSYFGFRKEVGSVRRGISLVGIRPIKNFVLWTAVFSLTPNPMLGDFSLECFRCDALRRGLFAKSLGRLLHVERIDETFTSAILQDIAVPFLLEELPDRYGALLEKRQEGRFRLSQLEREELGWTHCEAACTLFERWNLPGLLGELVQCHTDVEKFITERRTQAERLAVALSSLLPTDADREWHEGERLDEYYRRIEADGLPTLNELLREVDQAFADISTNLGVVSNVRPLADRYEEALGATAS